MTETILTHGDNAKCPKVQSGEWTFCHGHSTKEMQESLEHIKQSFKEYSTITHLALDVVCAAEAMPPERRSATLNNALRAFRAQVKYGN